MVLYQYKADIVFFYDSVFGKINLVVVVVVVVVLKTNIKVKKRRISVRPS
jgi:hypothetical protein